MRFLSRASAVRGVIVLLVTLIILSFGVLQPSFAQDGGDDDIQPAPPSIGADIPVTYFGPAPSQVDPRLVGPVQLLKSGVLDVNAGTITLPLYRGRLRNNKAVWYILTDTSDKTASEALGLNHSGKLAYAANGRLMRSGLLERDTVITFDRGSVDFRPARAVTPGDAPNFFPPKQAQPGSVGSNDYSPLVRLANVAGTPVYNAPMIAFDVEASDITFCKETDANAQVDYTRVHDKVVSICPEDNGGGTVTIQLTPGFSFAKPVLYMSTEASDPLPATLEGATYAPALREVTTGRDDSFGSPVERLFVAANGPMGKDNPFRQGLNSALGDAETSGPLNVFGGIPTVATDYSPLWDLNLYVWTQDSIDKGYRTRMHEEFQILGLVQRGVITGPNNGPFGSTGFIVNCPIVHRFL